MFFGEHYIFDPADQPAPVIFPHKYNRKLPDLPGLNKCYSFKKLIKGPETARQYNETLGVFHKHYFSYKKMVECDQFVGIDVRIWLLLERQIEMRQQDSGAARILSGNEADVAQDLDSAQSDIV